MTSFCCVLVCECLYLFICPLVCLSVCPSINPTFSISSLQICLCLSTRLPAYPAVITFYVRPSVCLFSVFRESVYMSLPVCPKGAGGKPNERKEGGSSEEAERWRMHLRISPDSSTAENEPRTVDSVRYTEG